MKTIKESTFIDKKGFSHPIKKFLNEEDMQKSFTGSEWNNYKILSNRLNWRQPLFMDKDAKGRPIISKRGKNKEFMDFLLKEVEGLGFKVFCNYKNGRVVVEEDSTSNFVLDYCFK